MLVLLVTSKRTSTVLSSNLTSEHEKLSLAGSVKALLEADGNTPADTTPTLALRNTGFAGGGRRHGSSLIALVSDKVSLARVSNT